VLAGAVALAAFRVGVIAGSPVGILIPLVGFELAQPGADQQDKAILRAGFQMRPKVAASMPLQDLEDGGSQLLFGAADGDAKRQVCCAVEGCLPPGRGVGVGGDGNSSAWKTITSLKPVPSIWRP
jgi:hypothetical protein